MYTMTKPSSFPIPKTEDKLPFTSTSQEHSQRKVFTVNTVELAKLNWISTFTKRSVSELVNDAIEAYNQENFSKHVPTSIGNHLEPIEQT